MKMRAPFNGFTGRGVRIAIVDSGINPLHPHVQGIQGGVCIAPSETRDYVDYNGHGTAVAGAIREKAPESDLFAVKIFNSLLAADVDTIIAALRWSIDRQMEVINLSLGTESEVRREELQPIVNLAKESNITIVSACSAGERPLFPGSMAGVIGVLADPLCPRDSYGATVSHGAQVFVASPYPRDIPGVPRERNLNGTSFAVANMTGFVARARQREPHGSVESLLEALKNEIEILTR